jgi:hypothetical protein
MFLVFLVDGLVRLLINTQHKDRAYPPLLFQPARRLPARSWPTIVVHNPIRIPPFSFSVNRIDSNGSQVKLLARKDCILQKRLHSSLF